MHLFAFDGVDDRLELLPLAARRALDRAGLRLSREGWKSLPWETRRALVEVGGADVVDVARVAALCAEGGAEPIEAVADPPSSLPAGVAAAYGPSRPIPAARWAALSPLVRYALQKVAEKARPERLAAAWAELVEAEGTTATPDGSGGR